jgi:hypothetical protein
MSHAVDEPAYEVLHKLGDSVEIRRYAPYVVAEVLIAGPDGDAAGQAFPVLAGYIFGKNQGERAFAMTAPVTQSAADGGTRVRFVLPKGVALATAPEPTDARVQLRGVAGHTLAAIRYSGFWSRANDAEQFERLAAALRAASMSWAGEPVFARYKAPWTPWFLRRNEAWLSLP